MREHRWLVISLFCLLAGPAAASGTYTAPPLGYVQALTAPTALRPGKVVLDIHYDQSFYDKVRLYNGRSMFVGDVNHRTWTLGAEYGIDHRSSATLLLPYAFDSGAAPIAPSYSGWSDARASYNYALLAHRSSAVIGTLEVKTPLERYRTTVLTAPGDNNTDVGLLLSYRGQALPRGALFYTAQSGYRISFGLPADEVPYYAEIGYRPSQKGALTLFVNGVQRLGGKGLGAPDFNGDFATLEQDLTAVGGRVEVYFGAQRAFTGQLYVAQTVRWRNSAPISYWGLSVSGHF